MIKELFKITLIILLFSCIFSGCSEAIVKNTYTNHTVSSDFIVPDLLKDDHNHIAELPQYQSDSIAAYLNEDGTKTIYIFSSPVKFEDNGNIYQIDNQLCRLEAEHPYAKTFDYKTMQNDITAYFPSHLGPETGIRIQNDWYYDIRLEDAFDAEQIETTNFLDQSIDAIRYTNHEKPYSILSYPSTLGVNIEIAFQNEIKEEKLTFLLKTNQRESLTIEEGGYAAWKSGKEIKGVIQAPILKTANGEIVTQNKFDVRKIGLHQYAVDLYLSNPAQIKGGKMFLSFEMRKEKQPDNAIYSKFPDLENAYLKNISYIGNSPTHGIGRLFIRFAGVSALQIKPEQVMKAQYYVYQLDKSENPSHYEMFSITEDWCSITGNWRKNKNISRKSDLYEATEKDHILKFDITKEVKCWCDDETAMLEHYGMLLKLQSEEGCHVLLSNDNTLFQNFLKIDIR